MSRLEIRGYQEQSSCKTSSELAQPATEPRLRWPTGCTHYALSPATVCGCYPSTRLGQPMPSGSPASMVAKECPFEKVEWWDPRNKKRPVGSSRQENVPLPVSFCPFYSTRTNRRKRDGSTLSSGRDLSTHPMRWGGHGRVLGWQSLPSTCVLPSPGPLYT